MNEHSPYKGPSYVVRIDRNSSVQIKKISEATRWAPYRIANEMIKFALNHVKLVPTNQAIYDMWLIMDDPGTAKIRLIMPQLNDLWSGMREDG